MLIYNEASKQMEHKEIRFTIAGRETSDEELNICIPGDYAELFDGTPFPDMKTFSRALMFAGVAHEAAMNARWLLQDSHEGALLELIKKCKTTPA